MHSGFEKKQHLISTSTIRSSKRRTTITARVILKLTGKTNLTAKRPKFKIRNRHTSIKNNNKIQKLAKKLENLERISSKKIQIQQKKG